MGCRWRPQTPLVSDLRSGPETTGAALSGEPRRRRRRDELRRCCGVSGPASAFGCFSAGFGPVNISIKASAALKTSIRTMKSDLKRTQSGGQSDGTTQLL